jgi:hypothetical protein
MTIIHITITQLQQWTPFVYATLWQLCISKKCIKSSCSCLDSLNVSKFSLWSPFILRKSFSHMPTFHSFFLQLCHHFTCTAITTGTLFLASFILLNFLFGYFTCYNLYCQVGTFNGPRVLLNEGAVGLSQFWNCQVFLFICDILHLKKQPLHS